MWACGWIKLMISLVFFNLARFLTAPLEVWLALRGDRATEVRRLYGSQ